MTYELPEGLDEIVAAQEHPIIFATVSGAHLYGFPSDDSDVDIRGVHLLPAERVLGLKPFQETVTTMSEHDGVDMDLVTHDLAKFCRLLLGRNGYVAEQVTSPLVVSTSEIHEELKAAVPACLTRHHAHHYLGFGRSQWELFSTSGQLKPLLYTFRVLATGIRLMRTGELEANLEQLLDLVPSYIPELISAKKSAEHGQLSEEAPRLEQLTTDVDAMTSQLEAARDASRLPEAGSALDTLDDLVVRARLRR